MGDWVLDHLGGIFVVAIVLLLVLAVAGGVEKEKTRERFMEQCVKDRKEYECIAMWRAGEPQVVPVPIIIPMSR